MTDQPLFEHTDQDGDGLLVFRIASGLDFTATDRNIVHLDDSDVDRLIAALTAYRQESTS